MKNICFMFSGRGSLLDSVQDGLRNLKIPARVSLVITNNSSNKNFQSSGDYDFFCIDHRVYKTREEHEEKIIDLIYQYDIDLIVLGGYRRILSDNFVKQFCHKTINTHPSLLPSFIGDKAQSRAIEMGVRITGATVHFINNEVDCGPIIMQESVNIRPSYSEDELKEAIINVEKIILSRSIKLFLENKLTIYEQKVIVPIEHENELFI